MKASLPARTLLLLSCALASACADDSALRHRDMEAIAARHEADLRHYEELRAEFGRRNPCPQRLEFPGQGSVIVHECSLRGLPGREEFWIKYTYLNSTGHGVQGAHIVIRLRDGAGSERSESSDARLPLGLRLGPDSSYTTFTQIGLEGLTGVAALQWSVEVRADG